MNPKLHQLTLQPTDVLFFKDGRPMEGASSGHGAAWPLPHVLDAALHAALHRSGLGEKSHRHTIGRSSEERDYDDDSKRVRLFGSLQTAGPFPVDQDGKWHFPRPADAQKKSDFATTLKPLENLPGGSASNLPGGLLPVVNTRPPNKDKPEPWLSQEAYEAYLKGNGPGHAAHFLTDDAIFTAEHNIGIGIDATTGAQDGKTFYSASYLRMKEDWSLGLLASCQDKDSGDLIAQTFLNSGHANHILAGGQQRTCTVYRTTPDRLPLPPGPEVTGTLVRWTLLSPAIFPLLEGAHDHPGGWLPTWIDKDTRRVQLLDGPGKNAAKRRNVPEGNPIAATLIAACIPKAIPITGWSLGNAYKDFGAKSTHLAVPAGSVYYFQCDNEQSARKLATALNWHGETTGTAIRNRRSTLLGEKGFGLGVCSNFTFHK